MDKKPVTSSHLKPTFVITSITIAIYALTLNPATSFLKIQIALICLILLLSYVFIGKKRNTITSESQTMTYLITATALSIVAATGWFFSPFFFFLYLMAIILAFIYSEKTSTIFIITLVILFSFNIGAVDLVYDFLVVLSLLTIIPITFYLRKQYLRLQEAQKDILIMKKEGESIKNQVQEILTNKINSFSVNLRQPITDIKLIAQTWEKTKTKESQTQSQERIIFSADEALRLIKEFETETTGKEILTTPKIS